MFPEAKKIQFGCGGNLLPGFANHDAEIDITKPLPYPDNSAEFIFIEHCMEHVSAPKAIFFLTECHRILKPWGRLRVCCPVVGPWLERAHARDLIAGNGHEIILNEDSMRTLFWAAGFELPRIRRTDRRDTDGHWRVITAEKDELETCRIEGTK